MFTGRIEEIGEIASVMDDRIVVRAPKSAGRVRPGGSLNVAGVCVTTEHVADGVVTVTVSAETRRRTTFDCCGPGLRVNVEPALAVGDPLDGHLVQGHVDAVGKVAGVDIQGGCPPALDPTVGPGHAAGDGEGADRGGRRQPRRGRGRQGPVLGGADPGDPGADDTRPPGGRRPGEP